MIIQGYVTSFETRESDGKVYGDLFVEGLRVSVPPSLVAVCSSLSLGVSHKFVVRHSWGRTKDGKPFPRLELIAVDGRENVS